MRYKLIIQKTSGKWINVGKSTTNPIEIRERKDAFIRAKQAGRYTLFTGHWEIIPVIKKKYPTVKRYPKGTKESVMTKGHYQNYKGKRRWIKPHKMGLGGKIMDKNK